jgi:hypothetical protein
MPWEEDGWSVQLAECHWSGPITLPAESHNSAHLSSLVSPITDVIAIASWSMRTIDFEKKKKKKS